MTKTDKNTDIYVGHKLNTLNNIYVMIIFIFRNDKFMGGWGCEGWGGWDRCASQSAGTSVGGRRCSARAVGAWVLQSAPLYLQTHTTRER